MVRSVVVMIVGVLLIGFAWYWATVPASNQVTLLELAILMKENRRPPLMDAQPEMDPVQRLFQSALAGATGLVCFTLGLWRYLSFGVTTRR